MCRGREEIGCFELCAIAEALGIRGASYNDIDVIWENVLQVLRENAYDSTARLENVLNELCERDRKPG